MTDKQIIDGVDVSGCGELCGTKCHMLMASINTSKANACEERPNCSYKQLKRKEQECAKWKHQAELGSETTDRLTKQLEEKECEYDKLKLQVTSLGYASEIATLETDNEHLINENNRLKSELSETIGAIDNVRRAKEKLQEENKELKAENEELKEKFKKFFDIDNQECWDIAFLNNEKERYKQALDEIEKVLINGVYDEFGRPLYEDDIIRNIIKKAKDGE